MVDLHGTCSNRPRPSVHNSHSKGHQWWAREVHHLMRTGDTKTLCGRDAKEWLFMDGPVEELLANPNCCVRCMAAAKRLTDDNQHTPASRR